MIKRTRMAAGMLLWMPGAVLLLIGVALLMVGAWVEGGGVEAVDET